MTGPAGGDVTIAAAAAADWFWGREKLGFAFARWRRRQPGLISEALAQPKSATLIDGDGKHAKKYMLRCVKF